MKKMINYYYKLYPLKIYTHEDETYFFDDEYKYYIKRFNNKKSVDSYINIQNQYKNNNIPINEILINKNNEYITEYEKKSYIVIKVKGIENIEIDIDDIIKYNIELSKEVYTSIEIDELNSMKKEIDKSEDQMTGYNKEYLLVQNVFNYYIGLAENAVSYLSDSIKETSIHDKSISHNYIDNELINKCLIDITNISYNYKLKDISEYFRVLVINNSDWEETLYTFLNKFKLNEFDYRFLYAEIIYPRYFFYMLNEICNKNKCDKELDNMIKEIDNVEKRINELYIIINKYCKIPPIFWINEKNN